MTRFSDSDLYSQPMPPSDFVTNRRDGRLDRVGFIGDRLCVRRPSQPWEAANISDYYTPSPGASPDRRGVGSPDPYGLGAMDIPPARASLGDRSRQFVVRSAERARRSNPNSSLQSSRAPSVDSGVFYFSREGSPADGAERGREPSSASRDTPHVRPAPPAWSIVEIPFRITHQEVQAVLNAQSDRGVLQATERHDKLHFRRTGDFLFMRCGRERERLVARRVRR